MSAVGSSPISKYMQRSEPFDIIFSFPWALNIKFKPLDFFGRPNVIKGSILKARYTMDLEKFVNKC